MKRSLRQPVTAEGRSESQLGNQREFMRPQSDRLISSPTLCVAEAAVVWCWRPWNLHSSRIRRAWDVTRSRWPSRCKGDGGLDESIRRETRSWWGRDCEPGASISYTLEVGTGWLLLSWKLTAQMLTLGTCSIILVWRSLGISPLHLRTEWSPCIFSLDLIPCCLGHHLFFLLMFQVMTRRSKVDDIKKVPFRKWKCLLSLSLPLS